MPHGVSDEIDSLHSFVINEAGLYEEMQAATGSDGNDLELEFDWVIENLDRVREVYFSQYTPEQKQHHRRKQGW